jgi:hypothetical protein
MAILSKFFDFFKFKSPKLFAAFIIIVGALLALDVEQVINLPDALVKFLVGLGLFTSTSTPKSE